jgi:3'-phosphoadenosine 5'-phosphosulfate sulfotransferase (PAPS reductase)/FAD synthetase
MKNILILGDSQTTLLCKKNKPCPTTGAALDRMLREQGHKVTRSGHAGKNTKYLLKHARKKLARVWDEVFVFSGGNDSPAMAEAVKDLLNHFEPSGRVFFIPLPPATLATSRQDQAYLFPKTAAFREKKNKLYKQTAASLGFPTVLDFRDAPMSKAVAQPSGVVYPSQSDGYHTRGNSAEEMAAHIMEAREQTFGGVLLVALSAGAAAALAYFLARRGD